MIKIDLFRAGSIFNLAYSFSASLRRFTTVSVLKQSTFWVREIRRYTGWRLSWRTRMPSSPASRLIASCTNVRICEILLKTFASGFFFYCWHYVYYVADAINKAKEFADDVGNIDRLCDENIELNKLNQSMSLKLKSVKESLAKAE